MSTAEHLVNINYIIFKGRVIQQLEGNIQALIPFTKLYTGCVLTLRLVVIKRHAKNDIINCGLQVK